MVLPVACLMVAYHGVMAMELQVQMVEIAKKLLEERTLDSLNYIWMMNTLKHHHLSQAGKGTLHSIL